MKLWSTSRPHSIYTIDAKANVCSVRFHPVDRHYLAYGSAGRVYRWSMLVIDIKQCIPCLSSYIYIDHAIHYVDLRKPTEQLLELKGHRKAVSYVQFINTKEIVSA